MSTAITVRSPQRPQYPPAPRPPLSTRELARQANKQSSVRRGAGDDELPRAFTSAPNQQQKEQGQLARRVLEYSVQLPTFRIQSYCNLLHCEAQDTSTALHLGLATHLTAQAQWSGNSLRGPMRHYRYQQRSTSLPTAEMFKQQMEDNTTPLFLPLLTVLVSKITALSVSTSRRSRGCV